MSVGMASETDTILASWLGTGLAPLGNDTLAALQACQRQAAARLQELRLPARQDEEWRFTDISELAAIAWQQTIPDVPEIDITPWQLPETAGSRLVFVNGRYVPGLSDTSALPAEVVAGNVAALGDRDLEEYFAADRDDPFGTLNVAGFSDVAVIWVPRSLTIERPIQLLFVAAPATEPALIQPRVLVVAEDSATVTVVEQFVSLAGVTSQHFTNAVTEVAVGQNARVTHARLQSESATDGFHVGQTRVRQSRDSYYTSHAIATGAKFSRHNLKVSLEGEQTETTLNGLSVTKGEQLADTHSDIVHHYPYGTSNQLHKCLLDDRSRSVFNGKIFVPQAAQQTNAAQLNRNLLLSPKARVDTKPQLQIVADNVKCAHGATVSQLEADEVFYLRSRGLTEAAARRLLVDAFAGEVLQQLPLESLRDRLAAELFTRSSATP